MSKDTPPTGDPQSRYAVPEDRRQAAGQWFAQARKLVDQRNYEYAIKSFIEGLTLDPEAVEEGYIPLRGCAVARWQTGGKKPGMMDSVKYTLAGKDAVKCLINAAWLLAHDPGSLAYAEALLKNANKAHCDAAAFWAGPVYREILGNEKKPNPRKFTQLKDIYEELGDRCQARGEIAEALKAYELGLEALASQRNVDPTNRDLENIIRDLATKLTIVKGNYQNADTFRESMQDSDRQAGLHDDDRLVMGTERHAELVEKARLDMEANPAIEAKVIVYVDLLCKVESDENERRAIEVLMAKFRETGSYRFKLRADDLAIRQMARHVRLAKAAGEAEKATELMRRRIRFEEKVYRERVNQYPTDLRLKYEYARRLFMLRKFDEAIPLFQQARTDPKVRYSCILHMGRCFHEKEFYTQAIPILREAAEGYELTEDDMAKELNYWLGRALEANGEVDQAKQVYGKLLQIDYNYRDVRERLERLG